MMSSTSAIFFFISLCIAGSEQYGVRRPHYPNYDHPYNGLDYNQYPDEDKFTVFDHFQPHKFDFGDFEQKPMPNFGDFGQKPMPNFGDFDQKPMPNFGDFGQQPMPNFGDVGQKPVAQPQYPILNQVKAMFEDPGLDSIGQPKDGKNHPCYRTCKKGDKKICYYKFHVEWYHSMSKACMNCSTTPAHCDYPDCVPANGIGRAITVVNRKMPGPSIEVCKGDTIVVDVENSLMAAGTTIHWHGLVQRETPYMDGTPYVTQCPIQPETTFRYAFETPDAGTFFWHSHIGLERGDGTTGALIIREPKQKSPHSPKSQYNDDKSEHVMLITDWINNVSISLFTDHHHSNGDNRPQSLLINGRGRFHLVGENNVTHTMKAPVFEVEKGQRYRFRMINAQYLNCPLEVSVDGHNMTVIASDGSDLIPMKNVAKLVSYTGERYDFIIDANKPVDTYWIRVRSAEACAASVRHVAVLKYKGATTEEPSTLSWDVTHPGLVLNAPVQGEEQSVTLPVSRMRTLKANDATSKKVPDHQIYLSFDMLLKNNTKYHRVPYYGTDKVAPTFWLYTPQLNHITMQLPKSPLLVTRPSDSNFCNEMTVNSTCTTGFCECPHVLSVKLNSVVEIILVDEGRFEVNHPFHLHGHSFRVVGQRRVPTEADNTTSAEGIKTLDKAGKIIRNLDHAPVKDTVVVPAGGYTIIRFVADNPGYWLFHCHIEFHAELGMSLVVKVGEHKQMKPVPKDFPRCGDFKSYQLPKPR